MSQNVNSIQPNPSDERHHKNMYIIAGCNGAGKTTAFRRELSAQLGNPQFVNPDVIAKRIDAINQWDARLSAGRETLLQIEDNLNQGIDFCVETTLTSRSYVSTIKKAHEKDYQVHLYYYWLESAEASFRRVQQRVLEGQNNSEVDNHSIPEDIIRRRYPKSVDNLVNIFIPIVDSWHVFDNNLGLALPVADSDRIYDGLMWDVIKNNDPNVSISSVNISELVRNIGRRKFSETVLHDKIQRHESVVYSIEGRVEVFSPEDVLWLYSNLLTDLEEWEITHLKKLAEEGLEQWYYNGKHFPASMILKLYGINS